MKDKFILYCSVAISVAALILSIWVHQDARHAVDQALREREEKLVKTFAPPMMRAYRDMGATNVIANPKTIEELLSPLIEIMNGIDESPKNGETGEQRH